MTNAEFKALPRYDNGDVVDLQMNQIGMTPSQVLRLTGDDQSRHFENEEAMSYMLMDAMEEFGL